MPRDSRRAFSFTQTRHATFDDDGPKFVGGSDASNVVSAFALNLDETVQPDGGDVDRYNTFVGEPESGPGTTSNGGADGVLDTTTPTDDYVRAPVLVEAPDLATVLPFGRLPTNVTDGLNTLFTQVTANYGSYGPAGTNPLTYAFTLGLKGSETVKTNLVVTAVSNNATLASLSNEQRTVWLTQNDDDIIGVIGRNADGTDDASVTDYVALRIYVENASSQTNAQLQVEQYLAFDHDIFATSTEGSFTPDIETPPNDQFDEVAETNPSADFHGK